VLKNNGDGTFQAKVDYGVRSYPHSVFCADLDGDTDLDLAVANAGSDNVSILKNNGDGTFQTKVDYGAGDNPYSVFCADLDGDTDLDLAVANFFSDNVSILMNLTPQSLSYTLWFFAYSPVDLIVTDPKGDSIGVNFNTIPFATYDTTQNVGGDEDKDDVVTIPNPLVGQYMVKVIAEPGADTGHYSLSIKLDGNEDKPLAQNFPIPPPDQVDTYNYPVIEYLRGDANSDKKTTVSDVIYLINYLFKGGPAPDPVYLGDVNCDGKTTVTDVVYLINYLFKGGPAPCS
jgi:hypothetical protein